MAETEAPLVELLEEILARIMGTSVAQIDATYGHLLPDSEDYLRGLLEADDDVHGLSTDLAEGSS